MTPQTKAANFDFDNSVAIQRLIAAASSEGVDTEILREILWLITAHTKLVGFLSAVRRLRAIFKAISQQWPDALDEADISSWQPVLDWVHDNGRSLGAVLGQDFVRQLNTTGHNPVIRAESTLFPMYASLCEPLPKGPAGNQFLLLSAHLLLGYVQALRENSTRDDYEKRGKDMSWTFSPNSVSPAARALRRYATSVNQDFLLALNVKLSPEDFSQYLEEADVPSAKNFSADHRAFVRFIEKCHGIRDWPDGVGGGGGSSSGGGKWIGDRFDAPNLAIEKLRQDPDAGEEDQWGTIETVKFQTGSNQKRKERIKSGLHPDEGESDETVLLSNFDCSITKQDPGAMVRAARSKARHVSKRNQVFSWTYDTLADDEIGELLLQLARDYEVLQSLPQWSNADLLRFEVWLFMQVTLWTGCDVERAMATEIRQADRNFDNRTAPMWIVVPAQGPIDRMHWRLKALTPTYATSKLGDPDQLRPHEKFLDLADLVGLAKPIALMVKQSRNEAGNRKLFRGDQNKIVKMAKEWLDKYFPGGRITLHKIESTLWSKLHRHTGDAALASCAISDVHTLASVRLHYTSPWVKDLQEHYSTVVSSMYALSKSADSKPSPAKPWMSRNQIGAVGARQCPTAGAIRSMFESLSSDIDEASHYVDRDGFIKYHNRLTLYCAQMFAYSTTCRAIKTPYLPLSSICSTKGLATLSDKDDEFHHKTRLVWIPPVLQKQMEYYDAHLCKLRFESVKGDSKILQEPCFLLRADYRMERVRPKTLTPGQNSYLQGVAANTHRRFLRTELLERGCPPEVVDAFMGHWQCGEEPFGPYSSFNFSDYINSLRSYLEPLLIDIGITKAIQSRIAH